MAAHSKLSPAQKIAAARFARTRVDFNARVDRLDSRKKITATLAMAHVGLTEREMSVRTMQRFLANVHKPGEKTKLSYNQRVRKCTNVKSGQPGCIGLSQNRRPSDIPWFPPLG